MHNQNIDLVTIETKKIIDEFQKLISDLKNNEEIKEKNEADDKKILTLDNLKNHYEILENEKKKLVAKEYIISVVGTMKSGKSMTINTIVGQEILPSRVEAMTTLPTIITHKKGQIEPILIIKKVEIFNNLLQNIKNKIGSYHESSNDIENLINSIVNNRINFHSRYNGRVDIESFLKKLNDLMRVAKELDIEPPYNEFENIDELPRIEVEFYHLSKDNSNNDSNFSLLDTPGPDEFKHSELLKVIFKKQIERSSGVVLLVDYTKMNNQSDVEVKEQVKEVSDLIGKKHLFVLINKFDERDDDKDIEYSKEEAIKKITSNILKDKVDIESVYPISAKTAFYANLGLRELDKKGEIHTSLNWIESFGKEVIGRRWKKIINDKEEVQSCCIEAWNDSFFEEPINNIIKKLYKGNSLNVISQSLQKVLSFLELYINTFQVRIDAYNQDIDKLEETIEILKNHQKALDKTLKQINNIAESKSDELEKDIKMHIKKSISNIKDNLNIIFNKALKKTIINNNDFHEDAKKKLNELKEKGKAQFDTRNPATSLIKEFTQDFNENIKEMITELEKNNSIKIKNLKKETDNIIDDNLEPIIKNISKKLGNISITLPKYTFDLIEENDNSTDKNFIKTERETYKIKSTNIFKIILGFFNDNWGYEEKTKNYFVIETSIIFKKFKKELEILENKLIENTSQNIKTEITEPLRINLEKLSKLIKSYRQEQLSIKLDYELEKSKNIKIEKKPFVYFLFKLNKLNKRINEANNVLEK